jgi:hypothetical protein
VCIIFIRNLKIKKIQKPKKPIVIGFLGGFFGFFWVGFLLPTLVLGPALRGLREGVRGSGAADTRAGAAGGHPHLSHGDGGGGPLL